MSLRLGWGLIAFLVVFQFVVRYFPHPWAVFVSDDWANWARGLRYASHWEALRVGLTDPNRPLSMGAVELCFRLFGRNPVPWTALSIAGNSLLLLCLVKLTLELTGKRLAALGAGIVFALLPNLTQTYHWSTQILNQLSCAMVFYALSGWMWVAFMWRGGGWRLAFSAGAYLVGLFSYEAGILLPAAYLVLLPWRALPFKSALRLAPFGFVFILYMTWRATDAFGLNQAWHYPPHMEAGISLWGIGWNIRQILHWWVGDHFFGSMLSGVQSFATLSPLIRRGLVIGNILLIASVGWLLKREGRNETRSAEGSSPFSALQAMAFAIVWIGVTLAIPAVSYTASRLMVLPALGISLLLGLFMDRVPMQRWAAVLFVPAVLALAANQGTAESYRQAGLLNERLYDHLVQTREEWMDKHVIFFDSAGIRHRQTSGLLSKPGIMPAVWAKVGTAPMHRGFTLKGIVKWASGGNYPVPTVVHDIENGARAEDGRLLWHNRYNDAEESSCVLSDVYVVDIHGVGSAP